MGKVPWISLKTKEQLLILFSLKKGIHFNLLK